MAQTKHGTGTISQQPNGTWRWQGYYTDKDGKRHRPSKTFQTEAEALKFQAEQIEQAEVKKAVRTKEATVSDVFEQWKTDIKLKKVKISETTRKNSISNINKHIIPIVGDNQIRTINTNKLQRYFKQLKDEGISPKTIYNIYTDLKKIVKYAMKQKIIFSNPIEDLEVEKPTSKMEVVNVMTFDEYSKIVSCKQNRKSYYYYIIIFLAETGLRAEELAIRKEDYFHSDKLSYVIINKSIVRTLKDDDKHTELRLTDNVKNEKSRRKVPLNIFAENAIEHQLEYCKKHNIVSPFIFCSRSGKMIEQRNILRALHRFCENAGIEKKVCTH